jgi:hypothetical protein
MAAAISSIFLTPGNINTESEELEIILNRKYHDVLQRMVELESLAQLWKHLQKVHKKKNTFTIKLKVETQLYRALGEVDPPCINAIMNQVMVTVGKELHDRDGEIKFICAVSTGKYQQTINSKAAILKTARLKSMKEDEEEPKFAESLSQLYIYDRVYEHYLKDLHKPLRREDKNWRWPPVVNDQNWRWSNVFFYVGEKLLFEFRMGRHMNLILRRTSDKSSKAPKNVRAIPGGTPANSKGPTKRPKPVQGITPASGQRGDRKRNKLCNSSGKGLVSEPVITASANMGVDNVLANSVLPLTTLPLSDDDVDADSASDLVTDLDKQFADAVQTHTDDTSGELCTEPILCPCPMEFMAKTLSPSVCKYRLKRPSREFEVLQNPQYVEIIVSGIEGSGRGLRLKKGKPKIIPKNTFLGYYGTSLKQYTFHEYNTLCTSCTGCNDSTTRNPFGRKDTVWPCHEHKNDVFIRCSDEDTVFVLSGKDNSTIMNCDINTNVWAQLVWLNQLPALAMFSKTEFGIDDDPELTWHYTKWN